MAKVGFQHYFDFLVTLHFRIPVTFMEIEVTKDTLVQDVLAQALEDFGLERATWNKYNLIEVSLERGVAERTANPQENMLQLVRNLRKVGVCDMKRKDLC